jgi:hypothetical protein
MLTGGSILSCGFRRLLFATILLFISSSLYSQPNLDKKITLQLNDVTLAQVLAQLSVKSGVQFSYNPKKIDANRTVSFQVTEKTTSEILAYLAERFELNYSFVEGQVILKPAKRVEIQVTQVVTLSGYIKDAATGEALIGATIYIKSLNAGVASNTSGFYSLTIPLGDYEIATSFIGYKAATKQIGLQTSILENILLSEDTPVLKEVVVTASNDDAMAEAQLNKTTVRPHTVEARPALFGEADVLKSLENIPGFKLHSDGSTFYYVRGGQRDQNLLLIDDSPIYNPSHMLGIFSTVIPDAVTDISIYKGDMPASLGGRLSSVLDIHTKKGNDQHTQVWGNVGFISTKLGVEGPITKNKSSFLLSGRFSRLKWLFQQADASINKFGFHDLTGKINFKLNAKNRVFFSFYSGSDNYFSGNNGINWQNNAATFRWNHILTERLFLNTTLSASAYEYSLFTDVANQVRWNSRIANANLKADFSYFINPANEFDFGVSLNGYNFNPGNLQQGNSNIPISNVSMRNVVEGVLYANHKIVLTKKWSFNTGLRLSSWTNTGEAFEFVFDVNHKPVDTLYFTQGQAYHTYVKAEPRVTIQYLIDTQSSVKASYARNTQNVHLISNSISPFTSLDVWLPSSINIKPQLADQASLGYYRSLSGNHISLAVEVFYKQMYNQIDYETHAENFLNPTFESELRFGKARAYGIEWLLKKEEGRLRGLVGYSYARAKRTFADLNDGKSFNAFSDRPHQANIMLSYNLTSKWEVGINWNYLTGAPFSSPVSFYSFNGLEVPLYGQKNNDRLPNYHRLDASATLKLNKRSESNYQHSLTFSIYNLYGRKNAVFINYNKNQLGDRDFKIPSNLLVSERTVSQIFLFQFTPAISYIFKWK